MDWTDALKPIAIVLAVIGGVVSLIAMLYGRRNPLAPSNGARTQVLYLASYICMSLSIFFVALNGLVR